jgi:hypothetical protein
VHHTVCGRPLVHIEQSNVRDFRPFVPTIAITTYFVRLLKTRSANMEKHYGPIIVLVNKVQHGLHLLPESLECGRVPRGGHLLLSYY